MTADATDDPVPTQLDLARLQASCQRIATRRGDNQTIWRVWGSGPSLILLHGGYGSWTHWIRNVEALAANHTVYAVDMPAFGDSDKPDVSITAPVLADLLWKSIDTIFGSDAGMRIVGFSFGGVIGIQMAALRPERIERLVVIGSGGYGIARPQNVSLSKWRHLESRDEVLAIHRQNLAALMFHDPQRIDDLALYLQIDNTKRARINSRDVAQSTDVPKILSELRVSIDGIWGAQDAVSKERLPLLKELLNGVDPQSEFLVIEDAGHWVQYEAADIVNEELARLLAAPRSRPESSGMHGVTAGSTQKTASHSSGADA